MSSLEGAPHDLEPFLIGLYLRDNAFEPKVTAPRALPSPLLDPDSLYAAMVAYREAADALRTRARSALKPGLRHTLANRILALAIFGERDHRLLCGRALAHFP
jgi:hypothetical protein